MGIVMRQWLDSQHVVVCSGCRTHLTSPDELISKDFQGQHGRAYLYATVCNVDEDDPVTRSMSTGNHLISEITCIYCGVKLGWKYVKAFEPNQRYKVGHYILERSLVSEIEQPISSSSSFTSS